MKTNIVLYGFMGAGKTAAGSQVATDYQLTFMDTDAILQEQEGATIDEIFRVRGELYFRGIERDLVRILARRDNQVISTGGGVPLDPGNLAALDEKGVGIYLRAGAGTLARRLKGATDRPLLGVAPDTGKIQSLLSSRDLAYRRIPLVIDTDRLGIPEVCRRVWQLFQEVRAKGGKKSVRA